MADDTKIVVSDNPDQSDRFSSVILPNLDLIKRLISQGTTDASISAVLGLPLTTYLRYKKNTELVQIYSDYEEERAQSVENALYKKATGHTVTLTETDKDGNTKEKQVYYPPDATAALFWLTNRSREKWKHRAELERGGNVYNILSVDKSSTIAEMQALADKFRSLTGSDIDSE